MTDNRAPCDGIAEPARQVADNRRSAVGFLMPAEWAPHTRTWMAWPPLGGAVQASGPDAVAAWAATANSVVQLEPLTMLTTPESFTQARGLLDPRVTVIPAELDDAWLRDSGPTFVVSEDGELGAVDWVFNGWGETVSEYSADAALGTFVAEQAATRVVSSRLVNEGGGIHVDGEGTVIVTETVQLHDRRNPDWSKADVEAELARTVGATSVIWLERGLMGDMQQFRPGIGTNGHVDVLAAFVRPGVVVVHGQPDESHHDHEVMAENVRRLREVRDARGRALELVVIDAPRTAIEDGVAIDHSYINFSFANGGLVMSTFGDPVADQRARETFEELFPERQILEVDARPIFRNGGGVHCITQQQPATP
jgi:agmatine deiminase